MKTISFAKIDKILKANKQENITREYSIKDGETISITVFKSIPLAQRMQMVEDIVSTCFVDGDFKPFMETAVTNYYIAKNYTNIGFAENPTDEDVQNEIEKISELNNEVGFIEDVKKSVFPAEINTIHAELYNGFEYRKKKSIQETSNLNKAIASLNEILDNVAIASKKLGNVDGKQLNATLSKIGKLDEKTITDNILKFEESKKNK